MGPNGSDTFIGAWKTKVAFLGNDLSADADGELSATTFNELSVDMEMFLD